MNILVTGGAGYIGSHTIIELIEKGYKNIYSIDNYTNSDVSNYQKIEQISGQKIKFENVDIRDVTQLNNFLKNKNIDVVIHFAALKSVPESVDAPLSYYDNNVNGLLNILNCMVENDIKNIIFSSSCSIYGNPEKLPVNEETPFGIAESPYARTKQIGENILNDFCKSSSKINAISLRYFNPVGAHHSGLIGEGFTKKPNNLVPIITQVAAGLREEMTVFGTDYDTKDGSCIRDYIHVEDVATAHVKALDVFNDNNAKNYEVINVGTGKGSSVLEIINSFERISGIKLNYRLGDRRQGDVSSIYADNSFAISKLKWQPKHNIDSMMKSAWTWQKNLNI